MVLVILNTPWVCAICIFTFIISKLGPGRILVQNSTNTGKIPMINNGRNKIVPIVLNIKFTIEVRFALTVVPNPANKAVMVVPILLPNNNGIMEC